jgi:uncharacterized 2Fe-2S/4Fe-4S cluster protein (DUF4445 family)
VLRRRDLPDHASPAPESPQAGAVVRDHQNLTQPVRPRPQTPVHLLPGAAAYIGADIIAGVFSSGMAYRSDTCLLVDLGTNGEIILKRGDQMFGCATAAGPAFEGVQLTSGVRAGRGAVSHIRWEGSPPRIEVRVIGDGTPIGLCGTAYVDFVAQARGLGLLSPTGRFLDTENPDQLVPGPDGGRAMVIARGQGGRPLVVSEVDIASLLQAKAAIAAGILCLLERAAVSPRDVATLYLAGGFGFYMDVDNVIACGLLPGFETPQIQLVGNTSLAGAYLALLDSGALDEMKQISHRLEVVELNLHPGFEACYIDQLALP